MSFRFFVFVPAEDVEYGVSFNKVQEEMAIEELNGGFLFSFSEQSDFDTFLKDHYRHVAACGPATICA